MCKSAAIFGLHLSCGLFERQLKHCGLFLNHIVRKNSNFINTKRSKLQRKTPSHRDKEAEVILSSYL